MSSSPRPPDARSLVAVAACSSASIACSTLLAFCLLFCLCVASLLGLSFAETEKKEVCVTCSKTTATKHIAVVMNPQSRS